MEFCFEKWNLFRPDPCIINLFEEAFNDDENRIFFCFVYRRTIVWFHQVTGWNRCLEISISRVNTAIDRRAYLVQLKIVSRRIKIVSRPSYAARSSARRLLIIPLGNRRIRRLVATHRFRRGFSRYTARRIFLCRGYPRGWRTKVSGWFSSNRRIFRPARWKHRSRVNEIKQRTYNLTSVRTKKIRQAVSMCKGAGVRESLFTVERNESRIAVE